MTLYWPPQSLLPTCDVTARERGASALHIFTRASSESNRQFSRDSHAVQAGSVPTYLSPVHKCLPTVNTGNCRVNYKQIFLEFDLGAEAFKGRDARIILIWVFCCLIRNRFWPWNVFKFGWHSWLYLIVMIWSVISDSCYFGPALSQISVLSVILDPGYLKYQW